MSSACFKLPWTSVGLGVLALVMSSYVSGQVTPAAQDEVTIVRPVADKAAGKVTLPGAFWNSHTAVWVETALCGRPSDFLHETIVSATTTRALLEQALRDIGCHDADAWADSVREFPLVRGDRFMILLEFARDGKQETFSLDELLTLQTSDTSWETPGGLGPFGFIFRGDPDHSAKPAASQPGEESLPDSAKILRDDPQIALTFKQLQNMSQSFADQPLAYCEDWPYPTINRGRNYSALPPAIYDSNGKIAVTLTFLKVTEEELLTQSAKVWHDPGFRGQILTQIATARQIDKDKAQYWSLRQNLSQLKAPAPELRDAEKLRDLSGHLKMLSAQIGKNYAALDSAWTTWMVDHARYPSTDANMVTYFKGQANLWKEHMSLAAKEAESTALAEEAAYGQLQLEAQAQSPENQAKLAALRGQEIAARSAALEADNTQDRGYWREQQSKLDPTTDPRDVWINQVRLHVQLIDARQQAATAGIAYGNALAAGNTPQATLGKLQQDYARASLQATLGEKRIDLASIEFEITKREGIGGEDPELIGLRKTRADLQQLIKQLEQAASQPPTRPQ